MKYTFFVIAMFSLLFSSSCRKSATEEPITQNAYRDMNTDSITFAVIGDFGKEGNNSFDVSSLVKSWNPDFVVTVGDNNYANGLLETIKENVSKYYCDFIYNPDAPEGYQCDGDAAEVKQNRFFPTLGNHDQRTDSSYTPYKNYFTLPGEEIYYDFEWGPVHFFTINSGEDSDFSCCTSKQSVWLKTRMEQSTKPFKIVFFHHSPYSSADDGNNEDMQWPFEEWGASAVLTGHSHLYQKIFKKENPNFPYIVNGLGGKSIHECDVKPLDSDAFNSTCYNEDYGAMRCTATKETILFQFFSVDNYDVPVDGGFLIYR